MARAPIGFKKASTLTDITGAGAKPAGLKRVILDTREYPVVVLYDALGYPRFVPSGTGNVERCLRDSNPLFEVCPICNGEHEPPDYDQCPKMPVTQFMICNVCGKKITDDRGLLQETTRERLPGEITPPVQDTPEKRIERKWQEHLAVFHPGTARMYGIDTAAVMEKFKR